MPSISPTLRPALTALLTLLLAALLIAVAARPAAAQAPAWDGSSGATVSSADPYDDASDAPSGGDRAYDDGSGGDVAYDDDYEAGLEDSPIVGVPAAPSTPAAPQRQTGQALTPWVTTGPPLVAGATVPGRVARMRADGRAAVPRGAPERVRMVIAAANQIIGKPYKWGGGHGRLVDSGYDCSGAVSYALIRASLLGGSMVSGALARWSSAGAGRWISVYANAGHVYMEVAGLRLDTSPVGDATGRMGVRWRALIGRRPGFHARHPTGL